MASFKKRDGGIQVSIRRKGYRPIYKTFDDTYEGEIEAHQWAEDIELKIKHGRHIDQDNSGQISLRDALDRYMREVTPRKKGHKRERNRILSLCEIPLTDRAMTDVTSMLLAQYRDEMLADGYSPSTVNNNLAILSQCYTIAITEWGIATNNPVKGLRRPQPKDERERRLREGEEDAILSTLGSPYSEMIVILLETAMRRGELFKLKWDDVKLREKYLILRDTKNGSSRSVPLSSRAIAAFKSLPRNISGKVFAQHPDTLSHYFANACKANGIEGLRVHDLRHEATSRLFEMGVFNVMEIASITGHKDLKMLKRYTHLEAATLAQKLG